MQMCHDSRRWKIALKFFAASFFLVKLAASIIGFFEEAGMDFIDSYHTYYYINTLTKEPLKAG